MALAAEVTRVVHAGNASTGPFSLSVGGVPITYATKAHLAVTKYSSALVATVLAEGTGYTISADSVLPPVGTAYPQTVSAATITLVDALAVGEYLLIERTSVRTQEQVLTNAGGFSSASNERAYDAMVRQIQELATKLSRTLRVHQLDPQGFLSLDVMAADREGKILGFGAGGVLNVIEPPTDGVDGAVGPTGPTGPTGPAGPAGAGSGDVIGPVTHAADGFPVWNGANTRTLKDQTAAQFRALLGLGSSALLTSAQVFQVSNNLSEGVAATKRTNLGLGSAALLTTAQVFQPANNLSEAGATPATMRTNLGLGAAAVLATATTADYRGNVASKVLTTDQVWAAGAVVALTDAATVLVDFSAGLNFSLAITANRTLGNPSNMKVGQTGVIAITQPVGGGCTLAYGTNWEFAGGSAPVLSTGANKKDLLHYEVLDSDSVFASLVKDVF